MLSSANSSTRDRIKRQHVLMFFVLNVKVHPHSLQYDLALISQTLFAPAEIRQRDKFMAQQSGANFSDNTKLLM